MYESPIKICMKQIRMTQDETIVRAVQDVGIFVDKGELIKALQYDRDQYEKGYADGLEAAKRELADRIASFLERDGNWETLKACWLIDGRSDELRKLLHQAMEET